MSDLTNADYFREFIGSSWNHVLSGAKLSGGVAGFSVHALIQQYQCFVEAVSRLSIATIQPAATEIAYPVIFRQSSLSSGPDILTFGAGEVFGSQPEGTRFRAGVTFQFGGFEQKSERYYVGVNDNVVSIGPVILNSLQAPSLVWLDGVDFVFQDGVVVFKTNPFDNPRIPRRRVSSSAAPDGEDEIVLWMTNVKTDSGEFQQQFGFAAPRLDPKVPEYFETIKACMRFIADGPSLSAVDHFIAAVLGLPCVREAQETVLSISTFKGDPLIVTDLNIYLAKGGFSVRSEVVEGAILECGHPLTDGSEVFDRTSGRKWWLDLDGLLLSESFFDRNVKSSLGFINQAVPVILGDIQDCAGEIGRSASFYLAGTKEDVNAFWSVSASNGTVLKKPLGNLLYIQNGIVDSEGRPDFSRTLMVNPLQFLAEQLIRDSVIVVQIRGNDRLPMANLFQCASTLKSLLPPWLGMIILVSITVNDEVIFSQSPTFDDAVVSVEPVSTRSLLRAALEDFPDELAEKWTGAALDGSALVWTPEACSVDRSPDLGKEVISFGDPSANVDSYGGSTLVCEESVETQFSPTCVP